MAARHVFQAPRLPSAVAHCRADQPTPHWPTNPLACRPTDPPTHQPTKGYMFAAWSFTSTFCAPILGWLSDKIGRRPVLLMSLLGAGSAAYMQGAYFTSLSRCPPPSPSPLTFPSPSASPSPPPPPFLGFAANYWMMLFARGFSGIWAAVGSTCNVYITDVTSPETFGNYAAKVCRRPTLPCPALPCPALPCPAPFRKLT